MFSPNVFVKDKLHACIHALAHITSATTNYAIVHYSCGIPENEPAYFVKFWKTIRFWYHLDAIVLNYERFTLYSVIGNNILVLITCGWRRLRRLCKNGEIESHLFGHQRNERSSQKKKKHFPTTLTEWDFFISIYGDEWWLQWQRALLSSSLNAKWKNMLRMAKM